MAEAPPDGPPRLRAAHPDDAPALATLAAATLPAPWSRSAWEAELAHPNARVVVATEGGHCATAGLLGVAAVRVAAGEAELLALAVAPHARRRGVGRALLEQAIAQALGGGAAALHLEVSCRAHAARRLYARAGFVAVGRRARYYASGEEAVRMARTAPHVTRSAERIA